jgi:hypothetical protein
MLHAARTTVPREYAKFWILQKFFRQKGFRNKGVGRIPTGFRKVADWQKPRVKGRVVKKGVG